MICKVLFRACLKRYLLLYRECSKRLSATLVRQALIYLAYSFLTLSAREHRFFTVSISQDKQLQETVCALKVTKNKIRGSCSKYDGSPGIEVLGVALPDDRFIINQANGTDVSTIIEKTSELDKYQVTRYDELASLTDHDLLQMVLPGGVGVIVKQVAIRLDSAYYLYLIVSNITTGKESIYLLKFNSKLQVQKSQQIPHFSPDRNHSGFSIALDPIRLFKKEVLSLVIQAQPELEKRYIISIQTLEVLATYSPLDTEKPLTLKGYLANQTTAKFLMEYYSASKESIKQREIVKKQSFKIKLAEIGIVPFFTVQEGSCPKASFFITTKEALISFRFPNFYGNQWCIDSIDSITVTDLNGDDKEDVLIMGKAMTGIGVQGAIPFTILGVYVYDNEMLYKREHSIEKKMNETCAGFKKIRQIISCYKKQYPLKN
jgi:hypothetical protein